MKYFFVLIFILGGYHLSFSQGNTSLDKESTSISINEQVQNVFYVEVLGNAGSYSFNYERRLDNKLWGRVGLSYIAGSAGNVTTVPIGLSNLFGKDANFFELGLVVSPVYSEGDFLLNSKDENEEFGVFISPTIGYRYQPAEENLFFKVAFTPLLTTFETTFFPWGGISVGYSF